MQGLVEFIETSWPRLIAFNEYVNEAGDEVTVMQFHPDAESMEAHMAIVRERAQEAYAETLDRAANTAAHLRGDLDQVLVEFADSEARRLVNERPSRSCASG